MTVERRSQRTLTDGDIAALLEAVEALRQTHAVPCSLDPIYVEHHHFVAMLMEREQRRIARFEKMRESAIGAVVVAVVGAVLGALCWIGKIVLAAAASQQVQDAAQHIGRGH